MAPKLSLYLHDKYDRRLAPVPASRYKEWWEDNAATQNHARHCLPLAMANSLGFYILSPGTFTVEWDGDVQHRAEVTAIEKSSHYQVDNHAAFGSFTVQTKFVPRTENPGDFVYVKSIPNERQRDYSCMEACIEAWWNPGNFGLVFMLNHAGKFTIYMGQPIAQMFVFGGYNGSTELDYVHGYHPGYRAWEARRYREEYQKDYDYQRGLTPDGVKITTHITNWKDAAQYKSNWDQQTLQSLPSDKTQPDQD